MEPYSQRSMYALKVSFDDEVLSWPGVTATTLMGRPGYMVRDDVFAILVDGGVVVTHLSEEDLREVSRLYDITVTDEEGRLASRWAKVPYQTLDQFSDAMPWVWFSYQQVLGEDRTLPAAA